MKKITTLVLLLAGFAMAQSLKSPDGKLQLDFMMSKGGIPYYTLKFEGKTVLKESRPSPLTRSEMLPGCRHPARHPGERLS
ncbi:MAG: glycoside hydrolase family 97 N-terminal domain-containing protein [Chitinophagaceae bacterium]|nr:glycoside hydrolase family 97 N-terminal domain-containing protein [Chitinophagaceae bacterium]